VRLGAGGHAVVAGDALAGLPCALDLALCPVARNDPIALPSLDVPSSPAGQAVAAGGLA